MPRPKLPEELRRSAMFLLRLTPTQKAKLDLLGLGVDGGASTVMRQWLDAQPWPSRKDMKKEKPKARAPKVRIAPSANDDGAAQRPARFIELDPNP